MQLSPTSSAWSWKRSAASRINLRASANKNPKQEYKREALELFQSLLDRLQGDVVRILIHLQIQRKDEAEEIERRRREEAARQQLAFQHAQASALPDDDVQGEAGEAFV